MMPPELCPQPPFWPVFGLGALFGVTIFGAAAQLYLNRLSKKIEELSKIQERRGWPRS